ncbi:MAG: septal ring lytic transglycosylase RlpA family protein [Epsilonproteobacteria bacterium]|nr:septal ring lytic transglycosylase RlpA family protein [Campylobacterota bacterium]
MIKTKIIVLMATLFIISTTVYADGEMDNTPNQIGNKTNEPRYEHQEDSRGTKIIKRAKNKTKKKVYFGMGSWYGLTFNGCRTASGERFKENKYTAAHRSLPFGTMLEVTDRDTGRKIVVKVNDRGPLPKRRIIDLSCQAGRDLGIARKGVFRARLEVLSKEEGKKKLELQ